MRLAMEEQGPKNVKVVKRSVDGRQTLFESVEAFRVPLEDWHAAQEAVKRDKVRRVEPNKQKCSAGVSRCFGWVEWKRE